MTRQGAHERGRGLPQGDLRPRAEGERVTTSALARADARERSVRNGDDEAPRRARARRAGAYRGVVLTDRGRLCALEVLRHHRLLERYLADSLGMSLDEVHAEADRLEHVLSEELEARIDAALGYPTHDPHGDPIPDSTLHIADATVPLGRRPRPRRHRDRGARPRRRPGAASLPRRDRPRPGPGARADPRRRRSAAR